MLEQESVTRYVITHIGKDGFRTLAQAQQGRFTYETPEEATRIMGEVIKNTPPDVLNSVWGLPLEVRPCKCYPGHFDPIGIYFTTDAEMEEWIQKEVEKQKMLHRRFVMDRRAGKPRRALLYG